MPRPLTALELGVDRFQDMAARKTLYEMTASEFLRHVAARLACFSSFGLHLADRVTVTLDAIDVAHLVQLRELTKAHPSFAAEGSGRRFSLLQQE